MTYKGIPSQAQTLVCGKHVIGNLYGVEEELLKNEQYLRKIVIEAAFVANMHLVELKSWKFIGNDKEGLAIIALVVESHISIYTWPRYRYATVDVYTCGEHSDAEKAFDYIVSALKPKYYTKTYVDRSCKKLV